MGNYDPNQPISIMRSYNVWRKITKHNSFVNNGIAPHLTEDGFCMDCGGLGEINIKGHGIVRCICSLIDIERDLERTKRAFESIVEDRTFDQFIPWGTKVSSTQAQYLKNAVMEWTMNPDRWLTIQGTNGCGKSHLLQAINHNLRPWTLYLSMTDLEGLYFGAMEDESEVTLQKMIDKIARHPILLLDDIGADYGSKFARSATRKIIDLRYRMYYEFPTVVTTNMTEIAFRQYDTRIADRIFDKSKNTIVTTPLLSFRNSGIASVE